MNTHHITTTELRTKSSELVALLAAGNSIDLIHRSQVIGAIVPQEICSAKKFSSRQFKEKVTKLHLPKLSLREIEKRYRTAMIAKHGKGIS